MVKHQFSCGLSPLRQGQAVMKSDHEVGEGQRHPEKTKVHKQRLCEDSFIDITGGRDL